ncbi:MAG: glutamate--tRNA ligase, partial [Acidimicrobiales bacterium]
MSRTPRVRIAPSPTGYFHVGTARTARSNWLVARQTGGAFVVRIEDTDQARHVEDAVAGIEDMLRWLGLTWDEGPTFQSALADRHLAAAERLWEGGHLYACDCSPEQVQTRTKGNATPGYDRHCRDRGLDRGEGRLLRFRVPQEGGAEVVHDLVRGEPTFAHDVLDDFSVVRANGTPLFLLANVVDDLEGGITHVIRGDDHLANTPKQQLLWRALDGGDLPIYAHLPMLVDEQRKKLSKRKGHQVEMEEY